jgi:ribosomal protein S18 acetylase RimI-like enzyme
MSDPRVLDNPVYASLTGPHAGFAERKGRAVRYPTDVTPFLALPDDADATDWADLAVLAGPGAVVGLATGALSPPDGWEVVMRVEGVQLVGEDVAGVPDGTLVRLGAADVPEMLDLVARTKPGPFLPRTVELGTYLGIRHEGVLIAMAGERLHPPGWTEISAVCTDPTHRGQGLATRLVHALVADIRGRGETPLLHAAADNTDAIRLYTSLGFRLRQAPTFLAVRVPAAEPVVRVPAAESVVPAHVVARPMTPTRTTSTRKAPSS